MCSRLKRYIVLIILLLAFSGSAVAQPNISTQVVNRELRVFFLSDFNLTGRGTSAGIIFNINIYNASTNAFVLQLLIHSVKNNIEELLADGSSKPTVFDPSDNPITNQNLFSKTNKFALDNYSISKAGNDLRDAILTTGKLPSGVYRFTFILLDAQSLIELDRAFFEIDVYNPSSLDLIAPGAAADRSSPEKILTTLPVFHWTSNITKFRLRLAEKLPDVHDNASPAEIIQDRIRYDQIFTTDASKSGGTGGAVYLPTTSFQYPSAGAWPLERGKVYYWQIIGLVATSGAELELPSEIWAFQVSNLEDVTPPVSNSLLMDQLLALLGDKLDAFFSSSGPLSGFSPTGLCMLNGKWLTAEEVRAILAKIASGEYILVDMRVE